LNGSLDPVDRDVSLADALEQLAGLRPDSGLIDDLTELTALWETAPGRLTLELTEDAHKSRWSEELLRLLDRRQ
jgi:hypothetical protein